MARSSGGIYTLVLEFARTDQPEDPFAFRFSPQTYTLRDEGGGVDAVRIEWHEAMLADLAALARPGCDPAVVQRVGDALRAILRPSGWERHERAIADAVARGDEIRVILRSAAAEIYALPWELLTIGASGRCLAELPRSLCFYTWPESQTAAESPSPRPEGGRILCAWSAAGGAVPAADHVRAIARAAAEGHIAFDSATDVLAHASLGDIARALQAASDAGRPVAVLHLLCHGGRRGGTVGLWLGGDPEPALVDPGDLRRVLAPHAGALRLVVLAACSASDPGELGNHLGSAAQALHRAGIQAVIASRFPLSIPGSEILARSLYRTLLVEVDSVEAGVLAARAELLRDPDRLDWASLQLYAQPRDGRDCRPVVFRPHRGLLAFEREHTRFFFGRDAERREAVADLEALARGDRPRFLVVAGASGTGKSSVVLAGVVPDLEAAGWAIAVMRPGRSPLAFLDDALARHPADARKRLLVVDQFEEVFTHASDEAAAFARRLWDMSKETNRHTQVLLTLRVDYLGRCGELVLDDAGLRLDRVAYDEGHRVFIAQMTPDRLAETIDGPLARVGLRLEPGLGQRLLDDIGSDPAGLPLLQYALDELWKRRQDDTLVHAALDAMGGVVGALTRHADAIVDGFAAPEQTQARRLLVRLVAYGSEPASGMRRREGEAALRPVRDVDAFARVTAALIDARLLVRRAEADGRPTLEIAHEALIRHWDRLWRWYQDERDNLARAVELTQVTAQARQHGQLLTGKLLAHAEALVHALGDEASPDARALVQRSRDAETRSLRRTRLFRFGAWTALTVTAVVLLLLRNSAVEQVRIADDAKQRAQLAGRRAEDITRIAVASQQVAERPHIAAALLREVADTALPQWRQTAFDIARAPLPSAVLELDSPRFATVTTAALTPDGTEAVTGHFDGSIRIWPLDPDRSDIVRLVDRGAETGALAARMVASVASVAVQRGEGGDAILAAGLHGVRLFQRRGEAITRAVDLAHQDDTAQFWRNPASGRIAQYNGADLLVRGPDGAPLGPARAGCVWLDPGAELAACPDDQGHMDLVSWSSEQPVARLTRDAYAAQPLSARARLLKIPSATDGPRRYTLVDPEAGLLLDLPSDSDPLLDERGLLFFVCEAGYCRLCDQPLGPDGGLACVPFPGDCSEVRIIARHPELGALAGCNGTRPRLLFVDPVEHTRPPIRHEIPLPAGAPSVLLTPGGERLVVFPGGTSLWRWDLADLPSGVVARPSSGERALVPGTSDLIELTAADGVAELRSVRFPRLGRPPAIERRRVTLPATDHRSSALVASATHFAATFLAPGGPSGRQVGAAPLPPRTEDSVLWGRLSLDAPQLVRRGVQPTTDVIALHGSVLALLDGFRTEVVDLADPAAARHVNVGAVSFDPRFEYPSPLLAAAFHPQGDPVALAWLGTDPALFHRRRHAIDPLPNQGPTRCGELSLSAVMALAFAPDGRWLAVGYFSGRIEVLPLTPDGAVDLAGAVPVLCRQQSTISALAFTPDSRTLLSGSNDGVLSIWTDFAASGADPAGEAIVVALPGQSRIVGVTATHEHVLALTEAGDLWYAPAVFTPDALRERLDRRARLCLTRAERMNFLLEELEDATAAADACPFKRALKETAAG